MIKFFLTNCFNSKLFSEVLNYLLRIVFLTFNVILILIIIKIKNYLIPDCFIVRNKVLIGQLNIVIFVLLPVPTFFWLQPEFYDICLLILLCIRKRLVFKIGR